MFVLVAWLAAAPALTVVHDGALPAATTAAAHLAVMGTPAALRKEPLRIECVREPKCADRPAGPVLAVVESDAGGPRTVELDLLGADGALLAYESVVVDDPALLDALLAPALDRIVEKIPVDAEAAPDAAPAAPGPSPTMLQQAQDLPWWVIAVGIGAGVAATVVVLAALDVQTPDGRARLTAAGGDLCGSLCNIFAEAALNACCDAAANVACALLCPASVFGAQAAPQDAVRGAPAPAPPRPGAHMRY